MKSETKLKLLGATFLTTLAFGASNAMAQEQAECPTGSARSSASGECYDDTVVVTGSRLRRDPTNAPAPLIQLTNEDLAQSGEPNLVDYLADVPALSGSTVPEDTTGSGLNDGGLSLLNLRNLGSVRTLVLVDGRRHVGAPQGSLSVDVDTIPSLLIDNVEIVTGGQSAVYGADAVTGVVNFILDRDFEGIKLDGAVSQINQDGQESRRISALIGHNFLNDRLNLYAFGEYQTFDEVDPMDMDWRREQWTLLNNDTDTTAVVDDGQLDNILIRDARSLSLRRGGEVILAGQTTPSPAADPDIPTANCTGTIVAGVVQHNWNQNINGQSPSSAGLANCFPIAPELNRIWVFDAPGSTRLANFGTYQDQNGNSRTINVGGDGTGIAEFGTGTSLPESEAQRYQIGMNFDITSNLQAFFEAKYVREETFDESQPTFFRIGISNPVANDTPAILGSSSFNIGLDNYYLNQAGLAPLKAAILANTRRTSATNATLVTDTRASLAMFGPIRTQSNEREVERYVAGLRGDLDQLGFIDNFGWEVGYTYGTVDNYNEERGVDIIRFANAMDAVTDVAGLLGTPGAAVCRVRLMQAQAPGTVPDQWNGGFYSASDPTLTGCVPVNPFGTDMTVDGYNPAAEAYYNASINVTHTNIQQDLLAFATGDLWDFWGAGPIGLSVGYEWRREKTFGTGRTSSTGNRFLFLNTGPDFAPARYNTNEYFAEMSVPLLSDSIYGRYMEISGAYRYSDYSTVGTQEARSFQYQYRPIDDILLRMTYGESVRVPNLSESYAPATQTFANGFNDPCDALRINALTDAVIRANRTANCTAIGIDPFNFGGPGILFSAPTVSVPGANQGNPFLQPERGTSYTASLVYTPSWLDNFSVVFDYYNIKITDAIAAVTAQQAANTCVSQAAVNVGACSTIFRDPVTQQVTGFIQGSLNYAKTMASGIDFGATYSFDVENLVGRDWGEVELRLRGNYLIRQEDFTDIANPGIETAFDSTIGLPRVRFLLTTSWSPNEHLSFIWDWDWQAEQEILDDTAFLSNPDDRLREYANTTAFSQHDFSVRWEPTDHVQLRAGVVNAFDQDPDPWLGSDSSADNFDLFGRRWFVGASFRN